MIADFTFFGRLKPGMMPLGIIANDASRSALRLDAYQQLLQTLRHEFARNA